MKLKTKNLNRLMKSLSGRVVDLYLYLVKRQDKIGLVKGIYYKIVMKELHMPRSTFYAALKTLEDEEFIRISQLNQTLYTVFIFDNSFLNQNDFKEGYMNLNMEFILSLKFIKLKTNTKKFFLRMIGLQSHRKPVKLLDNTLKEYGVYKRIKDLDKLFNIERSGDGYIFTVREDILSVPQEYTSSQLSCKQKVIAYCKDFNIEYTAQELIDTYKTISNHINKESGKMIAKAFDVILKRKRLQPKLISYLCGLAY